MITDNKEVCGCCRDEEAMVQRVLIVDDEEQVLDTLNYALVSYGLRVTKCKNASEALLQSMFDDFHFIITDYHMPGMNGLELARRLRERHPMAVIIGMSNEDKSMEFLHAGANDFLEKPFVPYRLAMMIDGQDLMI